MALLAFCKMRACMRRPALPSQPEGRCLCVHGRLVARLCALVFAPAFARSGPSLTCRCICRHQDW